MDEPVALVGIPSSSSAKALAQSLLDFDEPEDTKSVRGTGFVPTDFSFAMQGLLDTPMTSANNLVTEGNGVTSPEPADMATILATRTADQLIGDLNRMKGRIMHTTPVIQDVNKRNGHHAQPSAEPSAAEELEDGDTSDDESEVEVEVVKKISENRRRENAVLESYRLSRARQLATEPKKQENVNEDKQSTKWLVKHSTNQEIISTPREYQSELFEKAKEKNIIAVLDTGSGKTLIAVLLLRHMLNQELERRAAGLPHKIAFFLVDSVALVFQQYAVLDCNLSQPKAQFCGEMGTDLWNKELWETHFANNMAIVCTAEILHQCLYHSFIKMDQINLLIFDEAHHAKKNHSYARIIKDFYDEEENTANLPKIFGMTASPVDARTDIGKAAAELERLLHCQILTASDASMLQYATKKKHELIAEYGDLRLPFETPLHQKLHALLNGISECLANLKFATEASSELGPWCADQIWKYTLTGEDVKKLKVKTESKFTSKSARTGEPLSKLDEYLARIDQAQRIVEAHNFEDPELTTVYVSSKVIKLAEYLQERFERTTDDKCIVFVQQRYTARLLADLFSRPGIGTPHLRVDSLIGTRAGNPGDLNVSFRNQVLTLRHFRDGVANCLFATSVAEEGLDIPDCNLVIRFDLYTTVIQYIQSRGRARQDNSKYIHMIETGNKRQDALVKEVRRHENILKLFCSALPEDRLLTGNHANLDYFLAKERSTQRVYREPSTGAKLTYRTGLGVLANFVASLPNIPESMPHPVYIVTSQNKQFICEVILPENSPIRGALGRPAATKQVAKCSAAFEACLLLRKGKYLDEYLLSTFKKQARAMQNAALAITSKKQEQYDMRTKPGIWTADEIPTELYLNVLTFDDMTPLGRPAQPLGLLTRSPIPQLPSFPLFFDRERRSNALCIPLQESLKVDSDTLGLINTFTLRIFADVFSKEYETNFQKMPYFLVPVRKENNVSDVGLKTPSEVIAWDILKMVDEVDEYKWDDDKADDYLADRYVVDPFDGSRKLWSVKVAKEYKPLDPVPPNTAPRPGARKNNNNILEYSCSLWAASRSRRTFRTDQPVLEAEYIPLRRNLLDDSNYMESKSPRKCYIIPEPLKISALPTTVVAMAYTFPAVIYRIESYLIALEACKMLNLDIRPDLALEAMTKDSDNTEDHGEEQINLKKGMGKNYERLEFLGDCFLKMATSISLYTLYPNDNENDYHVKRMCMICNANLFDIATKLKLFEYIRSQTFNRRVWYPEGLVLKKGKTGTAPKTHKLAMKTIADVSEALIGASLLTHLESMNMDTAVRAVTELVCSGDHAKSCWGDYVKGCSLPKYLTAPATAAQRDLAEQVEKQHAYHFKHPRLLRSAFTHPSYPFSYEHIPSYQRLEFLGDSLLDLACVNFLYERYPNADPQWLTEHKMAMVSNHFLGALCVSFGFNKHLLQFSPVIQASITEYVEEVKDALDQAEQDAIREGKAATDCARDYWLNTKQPPKCLPDIIEAYIGALFVDSGFSFAEVTRFFDEHIEWYFADMDLYDTFANKHPVTRLNRFLKDSMGCVSYRIAAAELPDDGSGGEPIVMATLMVHARIVYSVERQSARYAKVAVAEEALNLLRSDTLADFREKWGCDCKEVEKEERKSEASIQMGNRSGNQLNAAKSKRKDEADVESSFGQSETGSMISKVTGDGLSEIGEGVEESPLAELD